MKNSINTLLWVFLCSLFVVCPPAEARKKRAQRRYKNPITHPVVLWSTTLSETSDPDEKKVAAFKLSQYSQPIYQDSVITTLIGCLKDSDVQIRILCAKAMGKAGNQSRRPAIRAALIEAFNSDPSLRETLVRTFMTREDSSKEVQDLLLTTLEKSTDSHETLALLAYFYELGGNLPSAPFISLFNRSSNDKVRRWSTKVLAEHSDGEPAVVELLATCAESKDTPLALTCLSGLQLQSRKDSVRTWAALEKTMESSDPDMLMATLDVINALPERPSSLITKRLIELMAETDDLELIDKAILALGVAGDQSETVIDTLQKVLKDKESQESTKIHAALVLGKQASQSPESTREALSQCVGSSSSQSLKSACELGRKELASKAKGSNRLPATSTPKNKVK